MNFLDGLVFPPRADHILIAKYIVVIVSLFFVSYIGILFGSTLFSLGFSARGKSEENPLFLRLSKDLADTFIGNFGVALILAVLPVVTLTIAFAEILYGTTFNTGQYFGALFLLTLAGIIFSILYKNSFKNRENSTRLHYALGLISLGALTLLMLSFAGTMSIILFPEEWPINKEIIPVLFDWIVIARFTHLIMFSLALTGVAILFFFFNWMGGKKNLDADYAKYVRNFGSGVGLGFTIVQTIFLLWAIGTLPYSAKSYTLYYLAVGSIVVLFLVSYFLYALLRDSNVRYGTPVFILFLAFMVMLLVNESVARENALVYQNYALASIEMDIQQKIQTERAERSGAAKASVELGEEIYNTKCFACHKFDQRVVGPPYDDVLPKYQGDVEKLKAFILNPVKVNPDYIAMPNQGLKPYEAESAAMFLLKKYDELTKKKQ